MPKPTPEEYPEFFKIYVSLIEDDDIVSILLNQSQELQDLLKNISEEIANKSYAFGKWTLKEVVGHMIDNERLFIARALRIARGDKQRLPGYDQDSYVKNGRFFRRTLEDLSQEMLLLRVADLLLIKSFDETELAERGIVNDYEITVNAILYVLAGHERHHINYIKENYLAQK
ncbi:MAG: DinB family protein [Ignavibacteria bacterium]|nr:DinB family protein [Ignavibacteria bacterium]